MRISSPLCAFTALAVSLTLGTASFAQNRDSDGEVISVLYTYEVREGVTYFKRNQVTDFKTPDQQTTQADGGSDVPFSATGVGVQLRQKQHRSARLNPQSFALD